MVVSLKVDDLPYPLVGVWLEFGVGYSRQLGIGSQRSVFRHNYASGD